MDTAGRDLSFFISETYWLVLNRAPSALELRDQTAGSLNSINRRCATACSTPTSSAGCGPPGATAFCTESDSDALEAALVALGSDVLRARAYESILARWPDESGGRHYASVLAAGERRTNIVRALATSGSSTRNVRPYLRRAAVRAGESGEVAERGGSTCCAASGSLPIVSRCTASRTSSRRCSTAASDSACCAEMRRSSASAPGTNRCSTGSPITSAASSPPTCMKVRRGELAKEGDPVVLDDPDKLRAVPLPQGPSRVHEDGWPAARFPLTAPSTSYSLSSIEHFGGLRGACRTMREMARVLKPVASWRWRPVRAVRSAARRDVPARRDPCARARERTRTRGADRRARLAPVSDAARQRATDAVSHRTCWWRWTAPSSRRSPVFLRKPAART